MIILLGEKEDMTVHGVKVIVERKGFSEPSSNTR